MSSPSLPALRQLDRLDKFSSKFEDRLSNALYGDEYQQCVPELQGDDLVWLVEYLDKALDHLDHCGTTFRKCLRELRSVCGKSGKLPVSHLLSHSLLNVATLPSSSGGFGDAYKGTLNGARVCIKRVRMYSKDGPEKPVKAFYQEAVMWKHLTHPNIVPLLGVTITPLQLISDWMPGGELREYLKNNPDAKRLKLLSGAAKGLRYLHSCNVIHGDLKGPNILVDDAGSARIVDFGLTTVTRNSDSAWSSSDQRNNTPRYTAPEVLNGGAFSKEADIFSFAMVMIEVFTGAVPFKDVASPVATCSIMQGKRPPRPTHPAFTEVLWVLMQRCWDRNPRSRPEASEVVRVLLTPERPPWKRLIKHTLTTDERVSLITAIFLDDDQVEIVENLSGDDAQTFVDKVDDPPLFVLQALNSLVPEVRQACVCYLHKICGRLALLPKSLAIPLYYDQAQHPLCHGGLADVWKGLSRDREVAVKVLRVYSRNDPVGIKSEFCKKVVVWKALRHPNVLPLLGATKAENRLIAVSEWMMKGNINEFVAVDPNADRFGPLSGVTKGLIYMHDQGVVHGNLNGANILIDNKGRARLTGFSLLTVASDRSTGTSSDTTDGSIPWMSPELFDPGKFGLRKSRPTKESDCYALGMVVYEVLSGELPYDQYPRYTVTQKILDGERPTRPQGTQGGRFTDGIWGMMELCWEARPDNRPSLNVVLRHLQGAARSPGPLAAVGGGVDDCSVAADNCAPPNAHDNYGLPARLQTDNPGEERIGGRLARSARKMFKAIA